MDSSLLCKICTSEYDEDNNIPYLLHCSHTICKECLVNICNSPYQKCPFCNSNLGNLKIKDLKPNYGIIDMIKDLMKCYEKCDKCETKLRTTVLYLENRKVELLCENCGKEEKFKDKQIPLANYLNEIEKSIENDKKEYEEKYYSRFKDECLKRFINDMKKILIENIEKFMVDVHKEISEKLDDKMSKYFYNKLNLMNDSIKKKEEILESLRKLNSFMSDKKSLQNQIANYIEIINSDNFSVSTNIFDYNQNIINSFSFKSFDSLKNNFNLLNVIGSLENSILIYSTENKIKESVQKPISKLKSKILGEKKEEELQKIVTNSSNFDSNSINECQDNSSYIASIIGLSSIYHKKEKLETLLKTQFKCIPSIVNLEKDLYGVQLRFPSQYELEDFISRKKRAFNVDNKEIELSQKAGKTGYRYYVTYKK